MFEDMLPSTRDMLEWFFILLLTFLMIYVWARTILLLYFKLRQKHHIKLVRELRKESEESWPEA